MKYGLSEQTITKINSVFSKYPEIHSVILYGSRAKGTFKPGSDIDLTVIGPNVDNKILNKISLSLDDLLLAYTVDLSLFSDIESQELINHINRVGITFYNKI